MVKYVNEKEYKYEGTCIKYLFFDSIKTNKLVIAFSAFSPEEPLYSYVNTLKELPVFKLYILDDYGGRGSYYLGNINNFNIENAVINLIKSIMDKYNIRKQDIVCIGSSKGGWAAIYYALKYEFGYVIAGEPQIKLAKYLQTHNGGDVISYMIDGSLDAEQSINLLDNLIFQAAKNCKKWPYILIHSGYNSYHYVEHILPFKKYIEKIGQRVYIDIENYYKHSELIYFFPELLIHRLIEFFPEILEDGYIKSLNVIRNGNRFALQTNAIDGELYAWRVFKDDICILETKYGKDTTLFYNAKEKGVYRFVSFVKMKSGIKKVIRSAKFQCL